MLVRRLGTWSTVIPVSIHKRISVKVFASLLPPNSDHVMVHFEGYCYAICHMQLFIIHSMGVCANRTIVTDPK